MAARNSRSPTRKVLVVDIGGTNIKLVNADTDQKAKFESGPDFTPRQLMAGIKKHAGDWDYDCVSIGIPTPVVNSRPAREPQNLGKGWMKYDFQKAFNKPCKVINDAAMQALGSYEGGRMLFIGLGTGLGSTLILDHVVVPLELGELSYTPERTFEDMLGRGGRKRLGQAKWEGVLHEIILVLRKSFVTDYIIIGGGNAKRVEHLPEGAKLGDNKFAVFGGLRLWGRWGEGRAEGQTHTLVIR